MAKKQVTKRKSAKSERPVLDIRDVKKIYKMGETEVHALRGVNLQIFDGDFVTVIGPSGSGKSTLLHIMGALDRPTSGSVYLDGDNVSKLSDRELAKARGKKIGFVFQFFQLVPSLTAQENVALPMWFQDVGYGESMEKAKEILSKFGLGERLDHLPNQLSGGQQQRVAIARALANDPKIILADEPTGNLDTESGAGIIEVLKGLNKEGKTIIIVTHDQAIAHVTKNCVSIVDGQVSKAMCTV
jgi:putative ABC transport system ATP-binding protein